MSWKFNFFRGASEWKPEGKVATVEDALRVHDKPIICGSYKRRALFNAECGNCGFSKWMHGIPQDTKVTEDMARDYLLSLPEDELARRVRETEARLRKEGKIP